MIITTSVHHVSLLMYTVNLFCVSGCKAHKAIEDIVNNKRLCGDIRQLSPGDQTYDVEVFHKVVCFFAPKSSHFFYPQMQAR